MNRSAPANAATTRATTQPSQAGEGRAGTSRSRSDWDSGEGETLSCRAVVLMRLVGEYVPAALARLGKTPTPFRRPGGGYCSPPTGPRTRSTNGAEGHPGGHGAAHTVTPDCAMS